jgi:hypothetical protein
MVRERRAPTSVQSSTAAGCTGAIR